MVDKTRRLLIKPLILGIFVILFLIMLTGCSTTVPITAKFPAPPTQDAMEQCQSLQPLNDSPKLSDVATTVANNYGAYYQCAIKVDTWIEWYDSQKKIFDSVSK